MLLKTSNMRSIMRIFWYNQWIERKKESLSLLQSLKMKWKKIDGKPKSYKIAAISTEKFSSSSIEISDFMIILGECFFPEEKSKQNEKLGNIFYQFYWKFLWMDEVPWDFKNLPKRKPNFFFCFSSIHLNWRTVFSTKENKLIK